MKEEITKITRTTEEVKYIVTCSKCGFKIIGSTEFQVEFNLKTHQAGKRCKNE